MGYSQAILFLFHVILEGYIPEILERQNVEAP